ncbi:MAG: alpha/beta hydrolase [Muribaculaceae bacterium]|nr:alpha/beta hydrolase [Muribaculaceae bacterium]
MNRELTYNGGKMHYTVTGEGDRIVILMHGWGCNTTTVESIRQVAAECGYRVITVDFPGHGESADPPSRPDGTPWGVEEFTALIEQLARQEDARHITLIGHSFGGRVAILMASRNDIDNVVLVDAAGVKPRRPLSYYYRVYSFKLAKWAALTFMGRKRGQAAVDRMRARRGSADYNQAAPMLRSGLSKGGNEDLTAGIPLIKAPTLLMWGEQDTATPLRDAEVMKSLIPDAGLVTFPGCGHYSFLDNRRAFSSVLTNFLTANLKKH